ncbi:MAG: Xaa-Pro peptidase family protein [Fimbriimonadales bacterium]
MAGMNEERHVAFQTLLKRDGFDCYLACTPISMGYLASFFEGGGERMLLMAIRPTGEPAMIVPALSETHASHTGIKQIRAWNDGEDPGVLFEQLAAEWNLRTAVIGVDDEMTAGILLRLQQALPAALFKCGGDTMADLRKRKSQEELDRMRKAAKIAEAAYEKVLNGFRVGMTESELATRILSAMAEGGGEPTFCIVAAGPNGAEPHHANSQRPIQQGDIVVIDWGCLYEKYHSDITRTISVGAASEEAKAVYQVVYNSHMEGRTAIKPGVSCESIDSAARQVIVDAGYGEQFVHRTGHGIGMMGHEPPHIVQGSKSLLEVGQCFSVEPGIYLRGKFGVRIENLVTVTENGHESFNSEPSPTIVEIAV